MIAQLDPPQAIGHPSTWRPGMYITLRYDYPGHPYPTRRQQGIWYLEHNQGNSAYDHYRHDVIVVLLSRIYVQGSHLAQFDRIHHTFPDQGPIRATYLYEDIVEARPYLVVDRHGNGMRLKKLQDTPPPLDLEAHKEQNP